MSQAAAVVKQSKVCYPDSEQAGTTHAANIFEVIDRLMLTTFADEVDILLDIRLVFMRKSSPISCIENYYKLRQKLDYWQKHVLEELRHALEQSIQLEVNLSNKRASKTASKRITARLNLAMAADLSSYYEKKMRLAAIDHKEARNIDLQFCWQIV